MVTRAFGFGNPYVAVFSVKHFLVIGLVVLTVLRTVLGRRAAQASAFSADGHPPEDSVSGQTILLAVNILFGIGVLFLNGMNSPRSAASG